METDANLVYDHLWIEGICSLTKLSQRGPANLKRGVPTYYLAKFSHKLHESIEN